MEYKKIVIQQTGPVVSIMLPGDEVAAAESIAIALKEKTMVATLIVAGSLMQLPTQRARERCMRFVTDAFNERQEEIEDTF